MKSGFSMNGSTDELSYTCLLFRCKPLSRGPSSRKGSEHISARGYYRG